MPLSYWSDRDAPAPRALDEKIVDRWHRAHPDHPVTLVTVDHQVLKDTVEDVLTSEPPDVMPWLAEARALLKRGLLADLTDVWDAHGLGEALAPRFAPMRVAGQTYVLPTSHYWWAVYYRPSVFAALNIPTPVETWDRLLAACAVLRGAGMAPFALGAQYLCPAAAWFDYLNLRLNGPAFHRDLMALKVPYTHDRVRAVFGWWRTLLGDFLGDPTTYDEAEAVAAVLRGDAGMVLVGSYVMEEYVPADTSDIDFFRFPVIDPALPVGEEAPFDGYVVPSRGPNTGAARAFLAFLGSQEIQQLAFEELGILPARADAARFAADPHAHAGVELLDRTDDVFSFYDLDTDADVAAAGMQAFVSFLREPGRVTELVHDVESVRLRVLRGTATTGPHPVSR